MTYLYAAILDAEKTLYKYNEQTKQKSGDTVKTSYHFCFATSFRYRFSCFIAESVDKAVPKNTRDSVSAEIGKLSYIIITSDAPVVCTSSISAGSTISTTPGSPLGKVKTILSTT